MGRLPIVYHSPFSNFYRSIAILILAVLLIQASFLPKSLFIRAKAEPENRIYIEAPQTIDASVERFNVTVWFDGSIPDFFAYQIKLTVDDSIIAIKRAWVPTNNPKWVFYGETIVPVTPAFYDNNNNAEYEACLLGGSLLLSPVSVSEPKILGIIELKIISAPAETTLKIDDPDTYILNYNLDKVAITKVNFDISIKGKIVEKQPSIITVMASPKTVPIGQNVTIKGYIKPERPYVTVHIRISAKGGAVTEYAGDVKADDKGRFNLTYSFSKVRYGGYYIIEASWDGDEVYAGSKNSTKIYVFRPYTKLKIRFAYQDVTSIGQENQPLPTLPITVNVTIYNVTNLHEWKIRLLYDPIYINISAVWLPPDNVFNQTNANFTVYGPEYGRQGELGYVECSAMLESEVGFSGNGTLFQFNITGIRPTPTPTYIGFSPENTWLINSTGHTIYYIAEGMPEGRTELALRVLGMLPVSFIIINPKNEKTQFSFYTTQMGLGQKFNVTIEVRQAVDLYGWKIKLTYNTTQLNASRIIDPRNIPDYIFYGQESSFSSYLDEASGTITANGTLLAGNPFTGNGTLLIIEFIIAYEPDEGKIESEISLDVSETLYYDGKTWLIPECIDGKYTLIYGQPPIQPLNVQATIAIVLGAAGVLTLIGILVRRSRKKEKLVFEDDVWEIEFDRL